MGIFDIFTKKKNPKAEVSPYFSSMERIKNKPLYDTLAAFAVTTLSALGLNDVSSIKSFNDDKGLLDSLVFSATIAPAYTQLKNRSTGDYLGVCGSNALGRGIYVAVMQNKLNKPISNFTIGEVEEIIGALRAAPDYELGLKTANVEAGSQNNQAFSDLVIKMANFYLENCSNPLEEDNLRSYMQALFNAGVTVIYR